MQQPRAASDKRSATSGGSGRLTAALGLMTALGSLSIHMIVPALPSIAAKLRIDQADVQLTIGLYLVAIALGQLGWGPLTDRFGRRPAMLWSLALFCTGSAICGLAPSIGWLLAGRIIQALGSSGTLVASRAMIADLAVPGQAIGGLATLATISLISPAIAPGIGGVLVEAGSWRTVFGLLFVTGIAVLGAAFRRFPETARSTGGSAAPWRTYAALLGTARFMGVTIGAAAWTAMMYHFLAASPFLLSAVYRLSPSQSGLFYLGVSGFMIGGSLLVRRMRRSAAVMLKGAVAIMALGIVLLVAAAGGLIAGLPALLIPMAACALASGICVPCALALAQESSPRAVATASSLFGALQMLTAALVASTLSHRFDHGPALMLSIAALALVGCLCFLPVLAERTEED
ncbi:MAG: multidrug effflux MFS transporter [Novosphingobium sp.]|nr:multidrug effflux MFS transporter [Novosphingobium sp.]